jgi:hypothetical protein
MLSELLLHWSHRFGIKRDSDRASHLGLIRMHPRQFPRQLYVRTHQAGDVGGAQVGCERERRHVRQVLW